MFELTRRVRRRRATTGDGPNGVALTYAAASLAPTSYARLRLVRQLHACGLLSGDAARAADGADPARRELPGGPGSPSC